MNIIRCAKGHFYDGDITDKCPFCESNVKPVQNVQEEYQQPKNPASPVYDWGPGVVLADMPADTGKNTEHEDEKPYVFVSYAHADSDEVMKTIKFLKSNHFNVWYDEGIKSGYEWADEISRKIKCCKQFLCFISENSIKSESVKDEIHIAWKYNINTIVIYLEKVDLDGGLEMKLDRKQAIMKYALDIMDFQKKLGSSITQEVVSLNNDKFADDLSVIDKYEIIRVLAGGGPTTTYLAENKVTGVRVVLKHGKYDGTLSGQRIKRSFEREKDALSRNISPFVPYLYDYFCDSGNVYIVESYIEGSPLNTLKHMPIVEKIKIFIKAAKVIAEFHDNGIYHCDIKPEHIIVNRHGCYIIDFGSVENSQMPASDDVKMGTVTYAAPEQFASYNGEDDIFGNYNKKAETKETVRKVDERTDIYAFGRAMVKTLSNDGSTDRDEQSFSVTTELFADVTRAIGDFSNNPLLQAIIEKMVRERKRNRYANMHEVIRVLEDFLKIYGEY